MDQSRRRVLKFIAAAPMTLTFAFLGDGLLRYIEPTMKPFGVFDPANHIRDQERHLAHKYLRLVS